jgi:hypothetical protein
MFYIVKSILEFFKEKYILRSFGWNEFTGAKRKRKMKKQVTMDNTAMSFSVSVHLSLSFQKSPEKYMRFGLQSLLYFNFEINIFFK